MTEADEIKADRSIIAYKKQAKRKISTKLTEDQVNNSNIELEYHRTQLSNTGSQEGVDHLVFQTEAAKTNYSELTKGFQNTTLIQGLLNAPRTLLCYKNYTEKKFRIFKMWIQKHLKTAETPRKTKL